MATIDAVTIVELVKILINVAFKFADAAGLDKDAVDDAYQAALAEFMNNDPSDLPDI